MRRAAAPYARPVEDVVWIVSANDNGPPRTLAHRLVIAAADLVVAAAVVSAICIALGWPA